jgi:hypothetical protein
MKKLITKSCWMKCLKIHLTIVNFVSEIVEASKSTKEDAKTTLKAEMENFFTRTDCPTKGSSKITCAMDTEFWNLIKYKYIVDSGKMMNYQVKGK